MTSTADCEQVLIQRLQRGDASAVTELATAFGPRIENVAFRYVRNREDAEEVAQDVLMKVSAAIGRFRGDAALTSWIHRITFNAAMSRLRRTQTSRRDERSLTPGTDTSVLPSSNAWRQAMEVADWSSMADDVYLRSQLRERFHSALSALPAIYRVPVELRDLQGLSTAETSEILGVSCQTVKSRLHRARAILRPRLAEFWGGLSLHRPTSRVRGKGSAPTARGDVS